MEASDQEEGGMASDVGGYVSSGGQGDSQTTTERHSFDENDRRKVALVGKKFAKLSLMSGQSNATPAAPITLRLEPWGKIPDPPKERHEYIKNLLTEPEGHRLSRLLGGDTSHHHAGASIPSSSTVSRSSSLSRSFSLRKDKDPVAKTSLLECFKKFTTVEILDGDNKFACEECAKVKPWDYLY